MSNRRTKKLAEAHVRLYRHELESPAYRSLCPEARALLVEFRALYSGGENRVYLSRREMQRRLGVGRKLSEKARDELLSRGFIRVVEAGGFTRKKRHASVYALTSEPLEPGKPAPKDFMMWRPDFDFTWYLRNPDVVPEEPRGDQKITINTPDVVPEEPREPPNRSHHVVPEEPTDKLPPKGRLVSLADEHDFMRAALNSHDETQFKFCFLAALLSTPAFKRATAPARKPRPFMVPRAQEVTA